MIILGALLLVAGAVTTVLGLGGASVTLFVLGAIGVLAALIRRFGRRGDFSRSGWSGF